LKEKNLKKENIAKKIFVNIQNQENTLENNN